MERRLSRRGRALDRVNAADYGDPAEPRGAPRDVDPAPLAWMLSVHLGTVQGDPAASMRVLAEGPDAEVHLARLLGACEYAARQTGGSMTRVVITSGDDPFADAVQALVESGLAAAAAVFRGMDAHDRSRVLDIIMDLLAQAIYRAADRSRRRSDTAGRGRGARRRSAAALTDLRVPAIRTQSEPGCACWPSRRGRRGGGGPGSWCLPGLVSLRRLVGFPQPGSRCARPWAAKIFFTPRKTSWPPGPPGGVPLPRGAAA